MAHVPALLPAPHPLDLLQQGQLAGRLVRHAHCVDINTGGGIGITRYYLNTCRLLRKAGTRGVSAVFPATAPLVPLTTPGKHVIYISINIYITIYNYLHGPVIVPVKVRAAVVGDVVPVQPGEAAAPAAAVAGFCI